MRIELTYQAWEARVLPLNYTRVTHGIIAEDGDNFAAEVNTTFSSLHGAQCLIEKDTEGGEAGRVGLSRCLMKGDTVGNGATVDEREP